MLLAIVAAGLVGACANKLTPEEEAAAAALRTERAAVRSALASLEEERSKYQGGLILALLDVRRQILLTTDALIEQRVHAIEAGAPVTVQIEVAEPDLEAAEKLEPDIERVRAQIATARAEADEYSGGLIRLSKLSTLATLEQTLAMLQSRQLIARHGLAFPPLRDPPSVENASGTDNDAVPLGPESVRDSMVTEEILLVNLKRKRFIDGLGSSIMFDLEFRAEGLDKPARAIKGVLKLNDLFDETKLRIRWTIEQPIEPMGVITQNGTGFSYNRFMEDHNWVRSTDLADMKAAFQVESILYQDGSRRDF